MIDAQIQRQMLVEVLLDGPGSDAIDRSKAYHDDPTFRFQIDMLVEMMLLSVKALCDEVPERRERHWVQEQSLKNRTLDPNFLKAMDREAIVIINPLKEE